MLSTAEFLEQQAVLGNAYAGIVSIEEMVESGLTMIAASDDVAVTVDLADPYAKNLEKVQPTPQAGQLRTATMALIGHIETRTNQPINGWLFANDLQVSQNFADLSAALGVEINVLNIE